jgi:hypothetical protein
MEHNEKRKMSEMETKLFYLLTAISYKLIDYGTMGIISFINEK